MNDLITQPKIDAVTIEIIDDAKKMKQVELAKDANLPVKTINEYESGKAIPNPNILNKISRVLGVKIKRN